MTPITQKFQYHVDAALYGYRWEGAQYIEVEYCATKNGDQVITTVTNVSAPPYLFGMIVIQQNWLQLISGIEDAARANAVKYFKSNVHPTIMSAIAPHI